MESNIFDEKWIEACVEGILFISEVPVKVKNISEALEIPEKRIEAIIKNLEKEYEDKKQ